MAGTGDGGHGRIETRRYRVSHDVGRLFSGPRRPGEPAMPGLAAIACVERFAQAVRAHRAIENPLHRVPDTAFHEDRARNRNDNGPENPATLRKPALNMLRTARMI